MCTYIALQAKNLDVVVGRTAEFGPPLQSNIITSPREQPFDSIVPSHLGKGLSWVSRYGYVYMTFMTLPQACDGLNEAGLSFSYLYLPDYTVYPSTNEKKAGHTLDYLSLGDWMLGNFKTVDDIKNALKSINVVANPVNTSYFKDMIFPLHIMLTDSSGQSLTIEWIKGEMQLHDNPSGILTNQPPYEWHLANLQNYVHLSPFKPESTVIDNLKLSAPGCGYGALGLPGDSSSPSRFIKTSFLKQYAYQADNGEQAINLAEHILNNVDIPTGVAREAEAEQDSFPDITQWTVFKDLSNRHLYFKSYTNSTLKKIELNQLNFQKDAKRYSIPMASSQTYENITENLCPR